jgi:hypothetical protein
MNNGKFQQLMESYGLLRQEKRIFYPRNFNLSERFLAVLREELKHQEKAGISPEKFASKLNRALQFHIDEHKKAVQKEQRK